MQEFEIEYFIENKYEQPVRKANFQLLVIPDSNAQQKVMDLKFYCSENQEAHLSKNIFGFETITYYIAKSFSEFWFKLSARIQKPEINPFYVSPLIPVDEFELIHSPRFSNRQPPYSFFERRTHENANRWQIAFFQFIPVKFNSSITC
jgi:hypothetical protein